MSVARLRALTHDGVSVGSFVAYVVEMSVARLRALTHLRAIMNYEISLSRNECCPFEGIDTAYGGLNEDAYSVEMSVARLRALTQAGSLRETKLRCVEMRVARLRALTHAVVKDVVDSSG